MTETLRVRPFPASLVTRFSDSLRTLCLILLALSPVTITRAAGAPLPVDSQRAPGVLYQAGGRNGWTGWKAPGWTVRNGELVTDGPAGEIRFPYVPGRQHIRNYTVTVTIGSIARDTGSGQELDLEARRAGKGGYMMSVFGCGDHAGDCLELSELGSNGRLYKHAQYPDDGYPILPGMTLRMTVKGTSITVFRQDNPDEYLMLHARSSAFLHGGFVALYNPIDDQHLSIEQVTISRV